MRGGSERVARRTNQVSQVVRGFSWSSDHQTGLGKICEEVFHRLLLLSCVESGVVVLSVKPSLYHTSVPPLLNLGRSSLQPPLLCVLPGPVRQPSSVHMAIGHGTLRHRFPCLPGHREWMVSPGHHVVHHFPTKIGVRAAQHGGALESHTFSLHNAVLRPL